jgi:hypothetical protein
MEEPSALQCANPADCLVCSGKREMGREGYSASTKATLGEAMVHTRSQERAVSVLRWIGDSSAFDRPGIRDTDHLVALEIGHGPTRIRPGARSRVQ